MLMCGRVEKGEGEDGEERMSGREGGEELNKGEGCAGGCRCRETAGAHCEHEG